MTDKPKRPSDWDFSMDDEFSIDALGWEIKDLIEKRFDVAEKKRSEEISDHMFEIFAGIFKNIECELTAQGIEVTQLDRNLGDIWPEDMIGEKCVVTFDALFHNAGFAKIYDPENALENLDWMEKNFMAALSKTRKKIKDA